MGAVERREVEEGLGWDVGARTDPAGSSRTLYPIRENMVGAYAPKLKWDGQETAEVISALHGICLRVFYSGFRCLPASLLCAAPVGNC